MGCPPSHRALRRGCMAGGRARLRRVQTRSLVRRIDRSISRLRVLKGGWCLQFWVFAQCSDIRAFVLLCRLAALLHSITCPYVYAAERLVGCRKWPKAVRGKWPKEEFQLVG